MFEELLENVTQLFASFVMKHILQVTQPIFVSTQPQVRGFFVHVVPQTFDRKPPIYGHMLVLQHAHERSPFWLPFGSVEMSPKRLALTADTNLRAS
jgi:hypothetical protein|tara:strand:- start:993 stop:1280 length:288 start_codon:yes stop_codon:yes gene_type:complete